jgi:protein TonB
MRQMLLASALLHAAAGVLLAAPPHRPPPAAEPARIELVFGRSPAPAAPARPATPGTAGPTAHAAAPAGAPGLQLEAPDPTVIPARADPGNPQPAYPLDAWAHGQQGTVVLRLTIDAAGGVTRLEKLASSGYPSLDAAAERALALWHFLPARRDGAPVASQRTQPVRFMLR